MKSIPVIVVIYAGLHSLVGGDAENTETAPSTVAASSFIANAQEELTGRISAGLAEGVKVGVDALRSRIATAIAEVRGEMAPARVKVAINEVEAPRAAPRFVYPAAPASFRERDTMAIVRVESLPPLNREGDE